MRKIKEYIHNIDLKSQLLFITIFSLIISFISLIIILPNLLTPFYEKNIYELLNQPLSFIKGDSDDSGDNIAFIVINNNNYYISSNFKEYFQENEIENIIKITNNIHGKFKIDNQTYYYNTINRKFEKVITITDDSYIATQRKTLSLIIFPVLTITLISISLMLITWGNKLVNKITKIKDKVDNLDNNKYDHTYNFKINDELNSLMNSVEYMRKEINSKHEYKNNMFQTISHELKTPISVISSYVEAANDNVVSKDEALKTIESEVKTLSNDVNKILQLNKLNYLKDNNEYKNETVDITKLLKELVKKYNVQRPDIKFKLEIEKVNIIKGTYDIWKTVIDNMFGNFVVYADKEIKVIIKDNKIEFYNDGPSIEDDLIKDIFTQYKKGIKGKFGLGLSIVKQSLNLYNYNITVKNLKKGVLFTIE